MTRDLTPQEHYDVNARRISGTHAEKLEQIDAAIQELLDIKMLECLRPAGRAVPGCSTTAQPRARDDGRDHGDAGSAHSAPRRAYLARADANRPVHRERLRKP